jgi:hypothetical protein
MPHAPGNCWEEIDGAPVSLDARMSGACLPVYAYVCQYHDSCPRKDAHLAVRIDLDVHEGTRPVGDDSSLLFDHRWTDRLASTCDLDNQSWLDRSL